MRRNLRQLSVHHQVVGANSQDGYTLTEMLVVIGIICLIAAVLTPGLLGQMGRARPPADGRLAFGHWLATGAFSVGLIGEAHLWPALS